MPQNCTNRACRLNKLKLSQKINEISQRPKHRGQENRARSHSWDASCARTAAVVLDGYGCAGDLSRKIERQTDISIINLAAIGIAIPVIDLLVANL